jgi:hypothetical protein
MRLLPLQTKPRQHRLSATRTLRPPQGSALRHLPVSTSFVERQNLSMRIIRRFTRLTNAFSKKIENHAAAVAIWFMYHNFCRVHQTLRVTPAMEAGISDHIWTIEELCGLLPVMASATKRIGKGLILKALGERIS